MQYNVNTNEKWHTTIKIEFPVEESKPKYDTVFNAYKNIKIEGFRKGKVPKSLIEKMYGDEIKHQAFQEMMDSAWKTILDENEFKILDEPRITEMNYDEKNGFSFQIEFDVFPEFEVKDYTDLPLEYSVYEITDEDVDKAVENLRQRQAMMYTVDGEAQDGHHVVADLQQVDSSGTPIIGRKFENQQLWLKHDDEELTPQLRGVEADEERRISLTINDPQSEDESGKEHFFNVKVNEIKERRLPDLDDEFARDVGDFDSLNALRDQVRKELEQQAEETNRAEFENVIVDEMIKRNNIEVPESVLKRYLDNLVEAQKERDENADEAFIRQQYEPFAERNIKRHYIMRQLIDQENISVDDKEVQARIDERRALQENGEEHAKQIDESDEEKENIKDDLLFKKVFDFLAEKGNITENKKSWYQEEEEKENSGIST
ncbi:MAG: trigger factor [candidate division KSB1 bacterium]|nr:trigger factor [candidate division KSB1 bacterium]